MDESSYCDLVTFLMIATAVNLLIIRAEFSLMNGKLMCTVMPSFLSVCAKEGSFPTSAFLKVLPTVKEEVKGAIPSKGKDSQILHSYPNEECGGEDGTSWSWSLGWRFSKARNDG